jgi:hypothetical protein
MEKFQELREHAKKKVFIADHIISQSYPFLKDTKLLLTALENVFLALSNAMGSVLYYERQFKQIPSFHDDFDSKFIAFQSRVVNRYKINKEYVSLIKNIRDILVQHKSSPVVFSRRDKYVICSDNYGIKTISQEDIKKYVSQTREFINLTTMITSKNEKIFVEVRK